MHVAAREGKVEVVRIYVNQLISKTFSVDTPMDDGWTAFMYSAVNGYLITTELLAKEGKCDINKVDRFGRTALHWVSKYNNKDMVKKLISLGINTFIKDREDQTAMDCAKLNSLYDISSMLLQHMTRIEKDKEREDYLSKKK